MGETMTVRADRVGKNFYNQKHSGRDFSGQKLDHADFRCASLIGCNFNDADLSYANFEGANLRMATLVGTKCYRTNFKDASLACATFEPKDAFGATFTFACESFDGIKIPKLWWYMWLMMLLRMKPPEELMELDVIKIIGPDRYAGLQQLMARRQF
jgi:hypothetical protein